MTVTSDILAGMRTVLQADATLMALVTNRIAIAVNGLIPAEWLTKHAICLAPERVNVLTYPAGMTNHRSIIVTVYCYTEHFGEEVGLMGNPSFAGLLALEQAVLNVLFPNNYTEVNDLSGQVCAGFWQGTIYPEAHLRNFEGLNEARIMIEYRA